MTPTNVARLARPARGGAGDPTGGHPKPRPSAFLALLLVLFLLSIYVEVPLYVTDSFFVPSVFSLVVLTPILALTYGKRVYRHEATFVGSLVLVLSLSALLSPGWEFLNQKLLGAAQTIVSVVGGILLLKLLDDLGKPRVARVLAALWVALLVGASLEVAGVLSGPSNAFREAAFAESGYGVYDAEERDVEITGFARPKLFTSEPSLLAIGFFAFLNSWLVLTYTRRRLTVACLATVLMLALVGSPVLLISLAATLAIALFKEPDPGSVFFVGALACVLGLGFMALRPDVFLGLLERISGAYANAGTLETTSENRRLVFPFITLVDVLWHSPLFGVGIGGKEVVARFSSLPIDLEAALGNNALFMLITYLGIVGSVLFGIVVIGYWRKAGVRRIALLLVLVLGLSQTMGGVESPRFWGYVFLFTGVVMMSDGLDLSRGGRQRGLHSGGPAPHHREREGFSRRQERR